MAKPLRDQAFPTAAKGGRTCSEGKYFHIAKGGGKIKLYLQYAPWPSQKTTWKYSTVARTF